MKFFTAMKLGPKMSLTPEGFLLCEDVPIARTGIQLYHFSEIVVEGEMPFADAPDGIVKIHRHPVDVFSPETIASFNGKPVVNEHPGDTVNPENWNELAIGTILNPRRGTGINDDVLLADIVVTNAGAIAEIQAGKREVSCGYSADYEKIGPGEGWQRNILGNHLALVEKGRCGARCSIGDESLQGAGTMKKWFEQLKAAITGKDEAKVTALLAAPPAAATHDEEMPSGVHLHIATPGSPSEPKDSRTKYTDEALEKKFGELEKGIGDNHKQVMDAIGALSAKFPKEEDAAGEREIEGALKEEAPAGTGDSAAKAKDSQFLVESYRHTVALAEIIAPGIAIPTFDSAQKPGRSYLDICKLRSKALSLGNNDPATNALITQARGGRDLTADSLAAMPCSEIRTLFFAVGGLKKAANSKASDTHRQEVDDPNKPKPIRTNADLNKRNREFYAQK